MEDNTTNNETIIHSHISDGKFILFSYKKLSDLLSNINEYACKNCKGIFGFDMRVNKNSVWSVGAAYGIDLYCKKCQQQEAKNIKTTPWIEHNEQTNEIIPNIENTMTQPTAKCFSISNLLLQFVGTLYGSLSAMTRTFTAMFDMQRMCDDVLKRYNNLVSFIQQKVGDNSKNKHLAKIRELLLRGNHSQYFCGVDEAWVNRAGNKSKVSYGFVFDYIYKKFISYNVESILICKKCDSQEEHDVMECKRTLNRNEVGSKGIGWICSQNMIHKIVKFIAGINQENDGNTGLTFVSDNDHKYTPEFNSLSESSGVAVTKADDVNHITKKIYSDFEKGRATVEMLIKQEYESKFDGLKANEKTKLKAERNAVIRKAKAALNDTASDYYKRMAKICLIEHSDDLETKHLMEVAIHMYNGMDHRTCPHWCKGVLANGEWSGHKCTLPWKKYYDRHQHPWHKYAFQVVVGIVKNRFDEDICVRSRGLHRTNANEVCSIAMFRGRCQVAISVLRVCE